MPPTGSPAGNQPDAARAAPASPGQAAARPEPYACKPSTRHRSRHGASTNNRGNSPEPDDLLATATGVPPKARHRQRLLWLLRHHLHREYSIIDQERRRPPIKTPPQTNNPHESRRHAALTVILAAVKAVDVKALTSQPATDTASPAYPNRR
jgi:hypothetical protein